MRDDLPDISDSLFQSPLSKLARYYKTHLERDIRDGRLVPADFWVVIRGLLISALQAHQAVKTLIADKMKPETLPLQAEILTRPVFETLGNVMALYEDRGRLLLFGRDGYLNDFRHYEWLKATYGGSSPKWDEWLREYETKVLAMWARMLRLSPEEANDPEKHILQQWPTEPAPIQWTG